MGFRRRILNRLGLKFAALIVWELPVEVVPNIAARIPVKGEFLSLEDVNAEQFKGSALASGDDIISHDEARRRIRSGDICLVAMTEGKLAAYFWYRIARDKYEPIIETNIRVADDNVLIYDAYVLPKFRRMAISEKMFEPLVPLFKSRGVRKMWALTEFDNIPGLRNERRMGFYPIKTIYCLRILCFKKTWEKAVSKGA
jgi:GNAT superfamily N-acetyltransferase